MERARVWSSLVLCAREAARQTTLCSPFQNRGCDGQQHRELHDLGWPPGVAVELGPYNRRAERIHLRAHIASSHWEPPGKLALAHALDAEAAAIFTCCRRNGSFLACRSTTSAQRSGSSCLAFLVGRSLRTPTARFRTQKVDSSRTNGPHTDLACCSSSSAAVWRARTVAMASSASGPMLLSHGRRGRRRPRAAAGARAALSQLKAIPFDVCLGPSIAPRRPATTCPAGRPNSSNCTGEGELSSGMQPCHGG